MRAHFQVRHVIYSVQICKCNRIRHVDGALLEYRRTAYGRVGEDIGGRHGRLPGGSGTKLNISSLPEDVCGSLSSGVEERRMRIDKVEFNTSQ